MQNHNYSIMRKVGENLWEELYSLRCPLRIALVALDLTRKTDKKVCGYWLGLYNRDSDTWDWQDTWEVCLDSD